MFAKKQVVSLWPVDAANFVDVAKPLRGDQGCLGASALEQRIDGHGGAMQKQIGLLKRRTGFDHPLIDAFNQVSGCRQAFAQTNSACGLVKNSNIGERSAHIGGYAGSGS